MTNKILVTVVVPMIEEKYDIYVPISKNVKVTINLLSKTINELSEGYFPIKDKYTLMNDKGIALGEASILKDCGVKNGDKLILI